MIVLNDNHIKLTKNIGKYFTSTLSIATTADDTIEKLTTKFIIFNPIFSNLEST